MPPASRVVARHGRKVFDDLCCFGFRKTKITNHITEAVARCASTASNPALVNHAHPALVAEHAQGAITLIENVAFDWHGFDLRQMR